VFYLLYTKITVFVFACFSNLLAPYQAVTYDFSRHLFCIASAKLCSSVSIGYCA